MLHSKTNGTHRLKLSRVDFKKKIRINVTCAIGKASHVILEAKLKCLNCHRRKV